MWKEDSFFEESDTGRENSGKFRVSIAQVDDRSFRRLGWK